jgi:hypothetical protein
MANSAARALRLRHHDKRYSEQASGTEGPVAPRHIDNWRALAIGEWYEGYLNGRARVAGAPLPAAPRHPEVNTGCHYRGEARLASSSTLLSWILIRYIMMRNKKGEGGGLACVKASYHLGISGTTTTPTYTAPHTHSLWILYVFDQLLCLLSRVPQMDITNSAPPRQSIAIAVPTVVLAVAGTAVGLRFYTRYALIKNVGADDWAVAITYVSSPILHFPLCRRRLIMLRQAIIFACGIAIAFSTSTPHNGSLRMFTVSDTKNGLGLHAWTLRPGDIKSFLRVRPIPTLGLSFY